MTTKPVADAPKTKVTLIAAHTHAGKACAEGDVIEVTATEKAFLIRHRKVAAPTPAAAQPTAKE